MVSRKHLLLIGSVMLMTTFPAAQQGRADDEEKLAAAIKRFTPTEITADVSRLTPGDRKALDKLIEAAKLMDKIYLRQIWSGNEAMQQRLAMNMTPLGKLRQHYFNINMSPWSRLDHNESFIPGVPLRRLGVRLD